MVRISPEVPLLCLSELYVSGWVATGPVGVLLATMQSGFTTGKAVIDDLATSSLTPKEGKKAVIKILAAKSKSVGMSEES